MADGAEHPDEARRDHATGVVVGDDRRRVADARAPETLGEVLRRGEGVAAGFVGRLGGEPAVEVEEDRAR